MEMIYDGTLVMPASHAVMNEDEMEKLDSGWAIENRWYGYDIYLTHSERKLVTNGQAVAGLIAGLASLGVAAAVIGAMGTIVWNMDDGYGVRIRMTGPTKAQAVVTGVYSLTSAQERSIASKNKVFW